MQTAFFLDDEFRNNISSFSAWDVIGSSNTNNEPANVSDPRPRVAWTAGFPTPSSASDTSFVVDNNNLYIDVEDSLGAGTTLAITRGYYTGASLASAITTKLATVSGATYTCSYSVASGLFSFQRSSGNTIKFLWKTGAHGSDNANDSLAAELGFVNPEGVPADTALAMTIPSLYGRWNTITWLRFKLPDLGVAGREMRAWLCEIATQELGVADTTIHDTDVSIYGANSDYGELHNWQDHALNKMTFSPAPYFTENQVRLAYLSAGAASNALYWLWAWRHQDSHKTHSVKLVKAFERTWSDTGRTLTTLSGQGMVNTGQPLGVDNYYPVQRLRRWVAPLAFEAWPAAEYRTVVQGVVHHGRQDGLIWALRWDDIVAGTVNAQDEADKGFLLWASLQSYSLDTYVGESADYISGDIEIEQLR